VSNIFQLSIGTQADFSQNGLLDMKFYTQIAAFANSLRSQEEGATAVEYGLMVSLIAVAIIGAVTLIGANLDTLFGLVAAEIPTVIP
jgi:pilus assembly protein Flp/PilA